MVNQEFLLTFTVTAFLSYLFHAAGITLGYHRLLSHKAYVAPKWLEYLICSGAYFGLEGSPIFWVATHRLHHRYSDRPGDPHSPLDGLWHAFIGWMSKPKVIITREDSQKICPDLWRDPVYRFLQTGSGNSDGLMCLAFCILFRLGLLALFGWGALFGSVLGTAVAFVSPLLVNSVCHMKNYGYQTYLSGDGSRNVWFVGLLALGEGWHNNHHAFPQSARHGLRPDEFDFSWLVLSGLARLGLVKDVRLPKLPEQKEIALKIGAVTLPHGPYQDEFGVAMPAEDVPVMEERREPVLAGSARD